MRRILCHITKKGINGLNSFIFGEVRYHSIVLSGFIMLFSCLYVSNTMAASISGTVKDAVTGKPIYSAHIYTKAGKVIEKETLSGKDGSFLIDNIKPGKYTLNIEHNGYESVNKRILLNDKVHLNFNVELINISVITGKEFLVTSSRIMQKHMNKVELEKPSTEYVVGGREAKRIAGNIENPVQAIVTLPGVSDAGELSSYMYVLGGGADENSYYLDGIPLFDPTHLGGTTSIYNDDMVDVMQFYPGGYPATYGNALRGILNVDYINGNMDKYTGKANFSLIDASVLAQGPLDKGKASFIIAARRTYYDLLINALDLANNTVIPSFYDVQAKLSYIPDDKLKIFMDYILSGDNVSGYLKRSSQYNQPAYGDVYWLHRQNILGAGLIYTPSKLLKYEQLLYGAADENNASLIGSSSNIANTLIQQLGAKGTLSLYPSSWDKLFLGYEAEYAPVNASVSILSALIVGSAQNQTTNYSTRNHGQYNNTLSDIFKIYSGFIGNRFTIAKRFIITPSLRYDYFILNKEATYSPSLELGYKISKHQTIKFVTGLYHQLPLTEVAETGNYSLSSSESRHFILTYEIYKGSYYGRVDAFYMLDNNLIYTYINPANIKFVNPCEPVVTISSANSSKRMTYGADVMLQRYVTGKWDGWISYTYMFTKQQDTSNGPWYFPQQDQRHTINVVADFRPFTSWEFSWRWSIHSGNPYTPITGSTIVPNPLGSCPDQPKTIVMPLQGYPDSERFPFYNRLDFTASKTFNFSYSSLKVYISVINLLDYSNVVGYFYNSNYTQKETIYSLPIIPYFGIEYDF